jgi:hypothetical protein
MWTYVIGFGIVMALEPLPVLAVIVLLAVKDGVKKAWAFFLGDLVVMAALAVATMVVHSETSKSSAGTAAAWVTLILGLLLLGGGVRWGLQLRHGAEAKKPKWMATLDRLEPWPAFLLGVFIAPYSVAVAVGAHIVGSHPSQGEAIAGLVVFLAIGLSTVYVPVALAQFWPERSDPVRIRMHDWLERNWRVVVVGLLLVLGAVLVAKGLVELL